MAIEQRIKLTEEAKKALQFWAVLDDRTQGALASQAIMKAAPIKVLEMVDDFYNRKSLPPKPESVAGFGLQTVAVHEARVKEAAVAQNYKAFGEQYRGWPIDKLKAEVNLDLPIKEDLASQELIRRWTEDKVSSRKMAELLGRSKSSINDYRAAQKKSN